MKVPLERVQVDSVKAPTGTFLAMSTGRQQGRTDEAGSCRTPGGSVEGALDEF
jgi:hypothetical protein